MIRPRHLVGTVVLAGAFTAPGCLSTASAAVPNCGGQNAAPQPVPYTCQTVPKTITANGFTRTFSAVLTANGTTVTVTYTMTGGVLPVDVPVRLVHHEGISGAGGTEESSKGFIFAGQTTATVTDSSPCRAGQADIKAVFTANGDERGRLGGPWIQNGTNCLDIASTVPTTAVSPPSSAVPPTVVTTTPGTPTSKVETSTPSTVGGALPATGSDYTALGAIGVLVILLGLIVLGVRRLES